MVKIAKDRATALALKQVKTDGCYEWDGPVSTTGYAVLCAEGKTFRAHKEAFLLAGGVLAEGDHVDHLCHNQDLSCPGGIKCAHRRCTRPDHLAPASKRGENLKNARWWERNRLNGLCPADLHPVSGPGDCRECRKAWEKKYKDRVRGKS